MSGTRLFANSLLGGALATIALALGTTASAQVATSAASVAPHTITVKLVQIPGAKPFGFEPAAFTAQRGDTLRFVEAAAAMHNVRFKTHPKGAKLGDAATSPYLTAVGQSYTIVIDARFTDGPYEIVCDPHEAIGMHALLTVTGMTSAVPGGKP
jgi:plastocyanin